MTTTALRRTGVGEFVLRTPAVGPTIALVVAVALFSLTTDTFLDVDNLSLVVQQSLVVGTLALGQTLVILTGGIDLANAAACVLGTLLMARLVADGVAAPLALLAGIAVVVAVGATTGGVVTALGLPPFIVTLGVLAIVTAASRIYAGGQSFPVTDGLLGLLGTRQYLFGQIELTIGMGVALGMYLLLWYSLTRTAWGRHVYAVGNDSEAARLSGIHVRRTLLSVYVVAGLVYGVAAWQALGRVPNADPNAFQTGNLDSVTAVVLGGTSLFGGRGSVLGTLVGALIVAVLRSGLTQAGIDNLYQDVATGVLVIAAVAVDRFARRRQR
ncbi:ABC transporter permease [Streptoalloteichus hindustanus]|uniref:Monosaccharide ABC transporter membrane protein, CUT2 family n=1 Tax=Streptoalloteichus hindustanus TaxID=2017 RepID=A0A1M4UHB7_STRHI|nr:ABC transporter permease [Streptoalloteichus hindustanus]SHE56182.1 monosaccharide ABC transporter membrane protein, CUT2 family [Streptoalloteichus hindustanus]